MPPYSNRRRKTTVHKPSKIDSKTKKPKIGTSETNTSRGNALVNETAMFYLPPYVAFKAIFCLRIISAIWLHISDCHETFSYWEPSHYLLFDYGFQLEEYSPKYALKSYLFLLIHAVPAWIYNQLFHPSRLLLFYFIRCFLALFCTLSEVFFYKGVCREFGVHIGRITLVILIFSPGMFVASTSFSPHSFSMYMTLLSIASWFYKKHVLAVFLVVLSSCISWAFSAIIGLPIAYEMIFVQKRWRKFFSWCILSAFTVLIPLIEIDSTYYGTFTFAQWNVLKRTIFMWKKIDNLNTPWYFYLLSGLLNFNISFLAALLMPLLLIWIRVVLPKRPRNADCFPYTVSLSSLFLWIAVFCVRLQKEERYLFPVYPLIALCGAVGVDAFQILWFKYFVSRTYHYVRYVIKISFILLILYAGLGISRMLALYKAHHAPIDTFIELTKINANFAQKHEQNLCIGKEWQHFPSSYFLPDKWKLHFINSEYKNKFPGRYLTHPEAAAKSTKARGRSINDKASAQEIIDHCDYAIELESNSASGKILTYPSSHNWTIVSTLPFLDPSRTPWIFRSFYIPFFWESSGHFLSYDLLQRNKETPPA